VKETKVPFFKKQLFVMLSEDCLKKRRARVRGAATLHQVEFLYMLSREPLVFPEKKRINYNGTNKGDLVGFVNLPEWETTWALTFDDKKKLYGKPRVAVGGPTGDDDDDDEDVDMGPTDYADTPPTVASKTSTPSTMVTTAATGRLGTNMEPVFYQAMPVEFYEDLMSSCFLSDVIHLTAGDGAAAKAALIRRVNYFGVCLTENHVEALYTHLTEWMIKQFGDPSSAFYQPSMNKKRAAPGATTTPGTTPSTGRPRGGETKPKKQKTAKAKEKESSSSSSDSESAE
jgi:hypothetical protein